MDMSIGRRDLRSRSEGLAGIEDEELPGDEGRTDEEGDGFGDVAPSRLRVNGLERRHAWRYTENRGGNHENRSDRRQWTDRVKARYQVARARARSSCRISQFRRQHTHGRGTGRSAEGCVGGR